MKTIKVVDVIQVPRLSLFFQGTEEVQVPTQPQAGVHFGARGANGRVSLLHLSRSCCYVIEWIKQGFVNHLCLS